MSILNKSAIRCVPSSVSNSFSTISIDSLIALAQGGPDCVVLMKMSKSKVLKSLIAWITPELDQAPMAWSGYWLLNQADSAPG